MVRWESVVISLIGAAERCRPRDRHRAGAVAGAQGRGDQGDLDPGPQIALYVALAAVAGVLAAIGPARSAAKVDVLKAVVTD